MMRKNKNRGFQQLRVWSDAIDFYAANSRVFLELPYSLRRVTSQQLASADSVHRNIAEGYCRRLIKESDC
jgi:four helix bundle protein